MALQADGKIVVAGTAYPEPGQGVFALARYNGQGALDTTFGMGPSQNQAVRRIVRLQGVHLCFCPVDECWALRIREISFRVQVQPGVGWQWHFLMLHHFYDFLIFLFIFY